MADNLDSDLDLGPTVRGLNAGAVMFGRYSLVRILGRGGMGVVWLAQDQELEIPVALKFLPEEINRDAEAVANLKRETRRGLELGHPHIVKTYGFLRDERASAIAMEFVDGQTLSALKAGRDERPWFEVDEIKPWARQMCEALDYAHNRARVLHRDLKPVNVMLNTSGEIKITDFGVAHVLQDSASRVSARVGSSGGTLMYMSPQQAVGERPTVADDVYSLGATLYDLLSGKAPFGGNASTIYIQVRDKVPPPIVERREDLGVGSGAAVPREWQETIAACLEKDPAKRPESAMEVGWRLGLVKDFEREAPPQISQPEAVAAAPTVLKRRRRFVTAAALLLLLLASAGVGWWFGLEQPKRRAETQRLLSQREADDLQSQHKEPQAQQSAPIVAAPPPAAASVPTPTAAEVASPQIAAPVATGLIAIATTPAGATVSIGDHTGKTPVTLSGLAVGKQTLKVALDGYEPVEREIDVKENETTDLRNLTLERSRGSAQITSTPQGISFELIDADGAHHKGKTPATIEKLATGSAKVIFKRKGVPNHEEQLLITKNQAVTARWQSADGAQPSATPQEGKPIAENAALNGPPNIRKLLGTFQAINDEHVTGGGSLTVTLSKDGTKITAVGHYNIRDRISVASIVERGSFSGTARITSANDIKINVTGQFSSTTTYNPGYYNRSTGHQTDTESKSTGVLKSVVDEWILMSHGTFVAFKK